MKNAHRSPWSETIIPKYSQPLCPPQFSLPTTIKRPQWLQQGGRISFWPSQPSLSGPGHPETVQTPSLHQTLSSEGEVGRRWWPPVQHLLTTATATRAAACVCAKEDRLLGRIIGDIFILETLIDHTGRKGHHMRPHPRWPPTSTPFSRGGRQRPTRAS